MTTGFVFGLESNSEKEYGICVKHNEYKSDYIYYLWYFNERSSFTLCLINQRITTKKCKRRNAYFFSFLFCCHLDVDFLLKLHLNISTWLRERVFCESDPGLSVLQLRDFANIPLQIQRNNSYVFSMLVNLRFIEQSFNSHGSFKKKNSSALSCTCTPEGLGETIIHKTLTNKILDY